MATGNPFATLRPLERETTVIPLTTICLILATNAPPETTIVVGAGAGDTTAPHIARWTAAETKQGRKVLGQDEIVASLHGISIGPPAEVGSLRSMLVEAKRLEGYFDTTAARGLRDEVLAAYERTRYPSAELLQVAADALHAIADGYLADGDEEQAFLAAVEAQRRFPDAIPDEQRYAPRTRGMLERAAAALDRMPTGRLAVILTEPGDVLVDGRSLGRGRTRFERTLPAGRYVLRVLSDAGTSFPRAVEIVPHGQAELAIDSALERCVRLVPQVTLTCVERRADHLQALMTASGADRAIGIFATDGVQDVRELVLPRTNDAAGVSQFGPLYLVPFGAGQLVQGRYGFAAAYAAAGVGVAAWHAASRVRFARLNDGFHVHQASDAARQVELSFWLLAGTTVVTVAEALIVGWLSGGTDLE